MRLRARRFGQLLLALLALWQGTTLLHLALVPHAVCPDGGEALDLGADGEPIHDHEDDHSRHDGCRHIVLLTHTNTVLGSGQPEIAGAVLAEVAAAPLPAPAPSSRRELYRLSPSHSPPARG